MESMMRFHFTVADQEAGDRAGTPLQPRRRIETADASPESGTALERRLGEMTPERQKEASSSAERRLRPLPGTRHGEELTGGDMVHQTGPEPP